MDMHIRLGHIWGIPVGLHPSWFLIFGLLSWSLASGYFPTEYPQLSIFTHWFLGLTTSALFFSSVLAHELGHSIIALRNNIPVNSITLFIFGGIAQIGREPGSPGVEFRIAIAGPIVSLLLGLGFAGLWMLNRNIPMLAAPSVYLMRINLILAVFNMIPGFPLDGGRVLRAIIWKFTGSFRKATQSAAFSGQLVAFGFIGFGIFMILNGLFLNGLWMAFIGWFLQNAAASSYAQVNMQHAMIGIMVNQVMNRDVVKVPALLTINQLVEEKVLTSGQRSFFVSDNGKLLGMLTLRDITEVPKAKWRYVTTREVMRPFDRLVYVEPNTELLTALRVMDNANVAQIPVVEGDSLVGMLSREQVVHYFRLRSELGI